MYTVLLLLLSSAVLILDNKLMYVKAFLNILSLRHYYDLKLRFSHSLRQDKNSMPTTT